MSEFEVHVNDPAYPAGTRLVVAGIAHDFENGETVTIDDSMVNRDLVPDLEYTLTNAPGFTVSSVGGSTPDTPDESPSNVQTDVEATPPQSPNVEPQPAVVAEEQTVQLPNNEGGDNQ